MHLYMLGIGDAGSCSRIYPSIYIFAAYLLYY